MKPLILTKYVPASDRHLAKVDSDCIDDEHSEGSSSSSSSSSDDCESDDDSNLSHMSIDRYYDEVIESEVQLMCRLNELSMMRGEEIAAVTQLSSPFGYEVFVPTTTSVLNQFHLILANQRTLTDLDRNCWLLSSMSCEKDDWVHCLIATCKASNIPCPYITSAECWEHILNFVFTNKLEMVRGRSKFLLAIFYEGDLEQSNKPHINFNKLDQDQLTELSDRFDSHYSQARSSDVMIRLDVVLIIATSFVFKIDLTVHDENVCHFCRDHTVNVLEHLWIKFCGADTRKNRVHVAVSKDRHYSGAVLLQRSKKAAAITGTEDHAPDETSTEDEW